MQLVPDPPPINEGETRLLTLKLGPVVGLNDILSFTFVNGSGGVTFSDLSTADTDATCFVTGVRKGTHNALATAELSSSETVTAWVRFKVLGEPCNNADRDYR